MEMANIWSFHSSIKLASDRRLVVIGAVLIQQSSKPMRTVKLFLSALGKISQILIFITFPGILNLVLSGVVQMENQMRAL
ncbi:MAG: hypothetical protein ACLQHM_01560 [Limisphaerales bacterium]